LPGHCIASAPKKTRWAAAQVQGLGLFFSHALSEIMQLQNQVGFFDGDERMLRIEFCAGLPLLFAVEGKENQAALRLDLAAQARDFGHHGHGRGAVPRAHKRAAKGIVMRGNQ
jgi:hypothetical protein